MLNGHPYVQKHTFKDGEIWALQLSSYTQIFQAIEKIKSKLTVVQLHDFKGFFPAF